MFTLEVKDEDIIMKISARKPVTKTDVVANFIGNLLTRAGGDIADVVILILTKDALLVEYIGHAAIGYSEEVRNILKISLNEITDIKVNTEDNEEIIKILHYGKELVFIRDNKFEDNLALAMANVISEIKTY